jgi:hypothetical protein
MIFAHVRTRAPDALKEGARSKARGVRRGVRRRVLRALILALLRLRFSRTSHGLRNAYAYSPRMHKEYWRRWCIFHIRRPHVQRPTLYRRRRRGPRECRGGVRDRGRPRDTLAIPIRDKGVVPTGTFAAG